MANYHYSLLDKILISIDHGLRTLSGHAEKSGVVYPAEDLPPVALSTRESKHVAGLMRVNHAGEICAQALYYGQALVSRTPHVEANMFAAALDEGDHLAWCQKRIMELGSHTSYLNPFWYAGSFTIGMVAGMIGDAWSLGFIAETETQVIRHLQQHRERLPARDERSAAILQQMEKDEAKHRKEAMDNGGEELPFFIKKMMSVVSKVMVTTAYWV